MQHLLTGLVSQAIAFLVGVGFCLGGAFIVINEERLSREREQLSAFGIEAVATVTAIQIGNSGTSQFGTYFDITYNFLDQAGMNWSGQTQLSTDSATWFDTSTPGERILDADIVDGDRILVTYLPGDPKINRANEECTNCADLGSFGENLATYVGLFFVLLGAGFLYALFRRGLALTP